MVGLRRGGRTAFHILDGQRLRNTAGTGGARFSLQPGSNGSLPFMPVFTKPPDLVAMGAGYFPGLEPTISGGVPLLQEFRLCIAHALLALFLQVPAIGALHAPDSVGNGGKPPVAAFAEPPDLLARAGGDIFRTQRSVLGRVSLPGEVRPQGQQVVGF